MAEHSTPEPVKYFIAVLWADTAVLPEMRTHVIAQWGDIDFEGPDRPFDRTDYYEAEMGPDLHRRLVSFAKLRSPEELVAAKIACIAIESALSHDAKRRVNLDIGYLDHNKLVLASVKSAGQKIYLRDGIFADLVARYAQGRYQPFAWTFPDFKDGRYDTELQTLRETYLQQMKAWRASHRA
jgi:hypothetical protein